MIRAATLLVSTAGVLASAGFAASTADSVAGGRSLLPHPSAASVTPKRFSSCPALVQYAKKAYAKTHGVPNPAVLELTAPVPTTSKATAPSVNGSSASTGAASSSQADAPAFSTTNNQEQGIDEPDVAKTNGKTIFTVQGTKLLAVDPGDGKPTLVGQLDLGQIGYDAQLLMNGNRLIVISGASPRIYPVNTVGTGIRASGIPSPYGTWGPEVLLQEIDMHDPAKMSVTQTMTVEGSFVAARQNGSVARIVISSAPQVIAQESLQSVTAGWVPTRSFKDHRTGRRFVRNVASCKSISHPVDFSGLGMVTILTLDFGRGLGLAKSEAVMADAQVVYGSAGSLYLATQKWLNPSLRVGQLPADQSTVIDRFDVTSSDSTPLVAAGEVPGYLLNQFSLSEYKGYLRVATTSRPVWWGGAQPTQSQSYVTVLETKGNVLDPVGRVSGLGQGEQIYSVRFVDDVGYVVTFHQVDPLYTIDLATPSAPRVAGELELTGYSSYLHPLGDGLLLGLGVAVDPAVNEPSGTQLDLFDVSDPAKPKLLQQFAVGGGSTSASQYDHHAFLFWPPSKLAVLPVQIYSTGVVSSTQPSTGFVGAIAYRIDRSGIAEVGRLSHDYPGGGSSPIVRSIVIGGSLYTVSAGGVLASHLDTFAKQGFAAFPPQSTPGPVAVSGGVVTK